MGIIVNDEITIPHFGLSKTGFYLSFGESPVELWKSGDNQYTVRSSAGVWVDQTAREENKTKMSNVPVVLVLDSDQLTTNLFALLYTNLKSLYTTTTDV